MRSSAGGVRSSVGGDASPEGGKRPASLGLRSGAADPHLGVCAGNSGSCCGRWSTRPRLDEDEGRLMSDQTSNAAFISYRRDVGGMIAMALYQHLVEHGIDAFYDIESIRAGHFDTVI